VSPCLAVSFGPNVFPRHFSMDRPSEANPAAAAAFAFPVGTRARSWSFFIGASVSSPILVGIPGDEPGWVVHSLPWLPRERPFSPPSESLRSRDVRKLVE